MSLSPTAPAGQGSVLSPSSWTAPLPAPPSKASSTSTGRSPAPQVWILVQSTRLPQLDGFRVPCSATLTALHHFCWQDLGWLQACNGRFTLQTPSHVEQQQRKQVSLIQFPFNYEQLRQSHLHSSWEPLHQHPGWLSGKLIPINLWRYSCWHSLCYSLVAPDQSGSGHVYGPWCCK